MNSETRVSTLSALACLFSNKCRIQWIFLAFVTGFLALEIVAKLETFGGGMFRSVESRVNPDKSPHLKYFTEPPPMTLDADCHCRPVPQLMPPGSAKSTCSLHATARGPGQVVFAYSLYGDISAAETFIPGILQNLQGIREFYPGAVMRLYFEVKSKHTVTALNPGKGEAGNELKGICDIFCKYDNLDICNSQDIETHGNISDSFGMVWRFAPMTDPLVSEFHSRDLDSFISSREQAAVQEWRDSGALYHVMRDHPYHGVEVLGGMFGMRVNEGNLKELNRAFRSILRKSKKWAKGLDQKLLGTELWPLMVKNPALFKSHDSYLCKVYQHTSPFPTQRDSGPNFTRPGSDYNFVGSNKIFPYIDQDKFGKCPEECRPADHRDWILC